MNCGQSIKDQIKCFLHAVAITSVVAFVGLAGCAWAIHFYRILFPEPGQLTLGDVVKEIPNSTLLGLMGMLTTVVALLAFIFYHVVRRDLYNEVHELAKDERTASKAETVYIAAYVLWFQHYAGNRDSRLLNRAIELAQLSVDYTKELSRNDSQELICKCKNNLAFFLAIRQGSTDKQLAQRLGQEVYETSLEEKARRYTIPPYVCRATWAVVNLRYNWADTISRRDALRIAKSVASSPDVPQEMRTEMRLQWEYIWRNEKNRLAVIKQAVQWA